MGHFDEYKKSSDPEVFKRAENWGIAIGLQAVDNLTVSSYLIELAKQNIEGKLTQDEVDALLKERYKDTKPRYCPSSYTIVRTKKPKKTE